jgi:LPS-assembly protein
MRTAIATLLLIPMLVALPAPAGAQQPPITETTVAERHDVINDKQHHYIGKVEMDDGRDTKLYADDVWFYVDENRAVASGNVVFRQGNNQISADRADFNTKTRLGTFYNATGFATVKQPPQRVAPGGAALPPLTGQDTIVYFFGETVEKIALRKYKIAKGGFTTCVQPTPRWDLHADTIVLNLDHYTLLKQVVMNVKGVPLFYLPVLYYPTKREDRATGFLLPTYGTSTVQGHSFHNAFFWAINRSQDATILHDWFSKAGQGVGTEYRYNFGGGSEGILRAHLQNQPATTAQPTVKSYQLNGSANQLLPGRLRASAAVDYFSSLVTNQTYNTNFNDASNTRRYFGGNVTGVWGTYSLNGTFNRTETFFNQTSSTVLGQSPRIVVTRNERPVPNTPLYVSVGGDYARILSIGRDPEREIDRGLSRLNFSPQVRFPFKKWQWFTANSTARWRDTYYSRSYDLTTIDPVTNQPTIVDDNLNRRYLELQSQLTGPVFNRIWDTPDNGYAEKFKHTVEPFLTVTGTSFIDNYKRIVKLDDDYTLGGTATYTYGVANRFYAKRRSAVAGQAGQAREILTVDLRQSYYSKKEASQVDPQYSSSNSGAAASNVGPISLSVRAQPTNNLNATANAEFDGRSHALRTITVAGTYSWRTQVQSSLSWTKSPSSLSQSLNGSSTVRTRDNKYGAIYSFNYDVFRSMMLQQKISGFYNAQCCGVALDFQNSSFGGIGVTSNHRFFMSFTLAGLGNFSPFNGALSGVPR